MTKLFFASDHHFGHENIIAYCNRPFRRTAEMDDFLIEAHNRVVRPSDDVYFLGDLSFHNQVRTVEILNSLNGTIRFVRGNHDKWRTDSIVANRFEWVDWYHQMRLGRRLLVMSRFPFDTWNGALHGTWHLHGHSHGGLKTHRRNRLDVGVDNQVGDRPAFTPWELEEVEAYMAEQKPPC